MDNERLVRCEESTKQAHKRIDTLQHGLENTENELNELKKTYAIMEKMDYRMSNVENSVDSIRKKIDESSKAKGMKWDKLIDYLFYAILAFALFKLGIK